MKKICKYCEVEYETREKVQKYCSERCFGDAKAIKTIKIERHCLACGKVFLKKPSERVQLAAVTEDGLAIRFIENPFKKVQLETVTQDGRYIRYINHPYEEVQLAAVMQNGEAIRYIENPSRQVQLAARYVRW